MLYFTIIYKAGVLGLEGGWLQASPKGTPARNKGGPRQMETEKKFYGMRNDYMFHAVLQKNEEVLRNLLATLLEMDEADIASCCIENPIELGKEIEGK